jgi:hypothetical protein
MRCTGVPTQERPVPWERAVSGFFPRSVVHMNHARRAATVALLALLSACAEPVVTAPDSLPHRALSSSRMHIVVLREDADPAAVARGVGAAPRYLYTSALRGFAAEL